MSKKTLRCHAKTKYTTSYGKDRKSELRFKRQNAMSEVRSHIDLSHMLGGADTGCLQASVAAKRK